MPSLDTYKRLHSGLNTVGQIHKKQSDEVMEATWDNDIATRTCYLYDYWHDDFITQLRDLHPEKDKNKIPISIKYLANASQTYDKDYVSSQVRKLVGDFFSDIHSDIFIPKSDIVHLLKTSLPEIDGVNIYILSELNETALQKGSYTNTKYT